VKRVEVSKVRIPLSQRMDVGVAPPARIGRRGSHSWTEVDMPRLEEHGLAAFGHALEEREVLDVARADLEDVGVLGDHVDLVGLHHSGRRAACGLLASCRN